jgi:formamidopyrimidine-DNA glycosylase
MRELPEVESITRTLRRLVRGREIRCIHVFHPVLIRPKNIPEFTQRTQGLQVLNVCRQGKYLVLKLDRGLIEIHFRFDGQLLWFSNARQLMNRANRKNNGTHVDVAFEFEFDSGVLGVVDPRHLVRVHVWQNESECRPLKTLGVDALSNDFTRPALRHALAQSKQTLEKFLLDQTCFTGIGNIYSCEALCHALLDPRRQADSLAPWRPKNFTKRLCLFSGVL